MKLEIIQEDTVIEVRTGQELTICPGDLWPAPYRGSKYSIRQMKRPDGKRQDRVLWARLGAIYHTEIFNGLISALRNARGDDYRGSIRITPWREVLCKKYNSKIDKWQAVYIGKLHGVIDFEGFEMNPKLQRGQFWRGFHFKHGETWAAGLRNGSDDYLHWSRGGRYFKSSSKHPELIAAIKEMRPRGGRCYITEYGHIWINMPPGEEGNIWLSRIRNLLREDMAEFESSEEYNELIESIAERYEVTKTRPIYLGMIAEFDNGDPPRTEIPEDVLFTMGTDIEDQDDEDEFSSPGYRGMRRD